MVGIGAVLVALLTLAQPARPTDSPGQCEEITAALCRDADLGYNLTRMPNELGHTTQDAAGLEVHQFFPLVKVQCSASLQPFLCLLYFPECVDQSTTTRAPCRELCLQARNGCESLMNKFGFKWPSSMDCAKLPSAAAGEMCSAPGDGGIVVSTTESPSVATTTTSGPASSPTSGPDSSPTSGPESSPTAGPASCRCEDGPPAPDAGHRELLERLLADGRALQQLQERTLKMQQKNMRLERFKLDLEIELLQRQLERE